LGETLAHVAQTATTYLENARAALAEGHQRIALAACLGGLRATLAEGNSISDVRFELGRLAIRIVSQMANDDPALELRNLLDIFAEGMVSPVPLFPKTSFVYAAKLYSNKKKSETEDTRGQALEAALKAWSEGGYHSHGENTDPYLFAAFGELNPLLDNISSLSIDFFSAAQRVLKSPLEHYETP